MLGVLNVTHLKKKYGIAGYPNTYNTTHPLAIIEKKHGVFVLPVC